MDQIAAKAIGQETTLPSLELGLEGTDTVNGVGTCDVGFSCAYQNRLAWSSPTTPLPVEANPRVVFERLFGAVDSTDPGARAARLRRQRSIIDSVLDKVRGPPRRARPGRPAEAGASTSTRCARSSGASRTPRRGAGKSRSSSRRPASRSATTSTRA